MTPTERYIEYLQRTTRNNSTTLSEEHCKLISLLVAESYGCDIFSPELLLAIRTAEGS